MALVIIGSVGRSGDNSEKDVVAVQARLIELGFCWLKVDGLVDAKMTNAIRLFQAIKNGHQRVAHRQNDGRIDVGGDTHRWLNAVNAPRWQIAPLGSHTEGFVTSDIFEIHDDHSFGTSWLFDKIQRAGQQYHNDYLASHPNSAPITLNDISPRQGGDTRDHEGHETGLACDLRLPKKDGSAGGITYTDSSYDQPAMQAMLTAIHAQGGIKKLFFNDPDLIAKGLCEPLAGHDDHAHVEIRPPAREEQLID